MSDSVQPSNLVRDFRKAGDCDSDTEFRLKIVEVNDKMEGGC